MQANRHEMQGEMSENRSREEFGTSWGEKNEANNRSRQQNVLCRRRLIARRRSQAYQLAASVCLGGPA
jgi:hypothetical protein